MGSGLSSEQRQMLEAFLRDQFPESWPQPLRERHAAAKRIAELMLVADGPEGTPEHRRLLAELLANKPVAPWSWVKSGPDAPYGAWTDERVPTTAIERHHKSAQRFGEKAVAGWIGHPAVAREVGLARPELNDLVAPLLLPDQDAVTLVAAHFLGGAGTLPDGSEWPNPFIGAPGDVGELAVAIQPRFVAMLSELAHRIEDSGAPLDATDPGVLLVLAQLALLDVDLTLPAAALVSELNIWPPGSVDREAAAKGHLVTNTSRHGRDARFQVHLAAFAEAVAQRTGPASIRPPYAGGQKRHSPSVSHERDRRYRAMRKVLQAYPDVTAGHLHATWEMDINTPGGRLRRLMELHLDDPPPSESTLRHDLHLLRRQPNS
jgi:hypothetical protein